MAGRKISRANMNRIQQIADHAAAMGAKAPGPDTRPMNAKADQSLGDQMEAVARAVYQLSAGDGYCCIEEVFDSFVIIEVCSNGGETYYQADYSQSADGAVTLAARDSWVQVEEVWQPVSTSAKGLGIAANDPYAVYASVKALGDRTLELCIAWGKDGHGESFTPSTDFDLDNYPTPPVAYYHGYKADGKPSPKPIYIGKTIKRENRADGHYLTAKLNDKPEADLVWNAALKSNSAVSPGTAGHLIRKEKDGTLTYWPVVEISAWDYADSRKQAHPRSRAFPVLKSLYTEAGIALPSSIQPPEVPGDGTSADVIDDTTARQAIIAAVAAGLRTIRS
jgi:hypothetical protein